MKKRSFEGKGEERKGTSEQTPSTSYKSREEET